jgi:hypothetical protein
MRGAFALSLPRGFIVVQCPERSGYPEARRHSLSLFTFSLPLPLCIIQLPITPRVSRHNTHQPWGNPMVFS